MGSGFKNEPRRYPPNKHVSWKPAGEAKAKNHDLTNADLQKLAATHEANLNNNNVFAGKNLSDNTKITSFYTLKALPPYQSPLNYYGANTKIDPIQKEGATKN